MTNRLAHETSPYLLQHANNPVDWYAWGEEALAAAQEQDRPIFLSIGYSACHWCHVMEHESFENADIAALMNQWFINIKVDREERPDLDQIYMNAVLAMTGSGGWPMSVFLTPDGRPFYGGTYWPPESKFGRPGFPQVLQAVHEAWTDRREQLLGQADDLTDVVAQMSAVAGEPSELNDQQLRTAARVLTRHADRRHGGFGQAPKFPHPFDLRVLLRCARRFEDSDALDVVRLTLDKMAGGGIYDHLGGGFHRYSTDARWLVPHFEKMLYDNALLVPAYLEAFQATGDEEYRRVVTETLDFVLREMTSPEGGFYSTLDADSEGEEGKFFVWTRPEIETLLGSQRAAVFSAAYDVSPEGNWEGKTILNRPRPWPEVADELGVSLDELEATLAECRRVLFDARARRIAPGRDDKILVSWNGLMIAAMAMASTILDDQRYRTAAENAAKFALNTLRESDGRLLHAYKDGRARFNGYLDDYACLADGLAELYQATFDEQWLEAALSLVERMREQFADPNAGGFFYTADDHERLIVRQKDSQDNATPSGNAMAATALLKLARLTGRNDLETLAVRTLEWLSSQMERAPSASGQALIALDFLLGPTREIVAAGGSETTLARVLQELSRRFVPNKVVLRRPVGLADEELPPAIRPLLAGKPASGEIMVYICEHGTCGLPATGEDAAIEAIRKLSEAMA